MFKTIFSVLVLICCLHYSDSFLSCKPQREFSLWAPCQATCEHKKPVFCIRRPGCYCANGKIWDPQHHLCVRKAECLGRNSNHGGEFHGGISFHGEGSGSASGEGSGSASGGGSGSVSGEGSGSASGGGGSSASISIHGNVNGHSLLKQLTAIPRTIVKAVIKIFWTMITFDFAAAKLPLTVGRKVVTAVLTVVKTVVQDALKYALKFGALNAEMVAEAIKKIKAGVSWVIRTMASANIFQIKLAFNIGKWFHAKIENIVGGILKFGIGLVAEAGHVVDGVIKMSHVKGIFKLPVIKQIIHLQMKVHGKLIAMIYSQFRQLGNFIESIIYQHKDFFIPIFHKVLNAVLAVTEAVQQIMDGGKFSGISATLGKIHIALGPLLSGRWKICGIGDKPIGEGSVSADGGFSVSEMPTTDDKSHEKSDGSSEKSNDKSNGSSEKSDEKSDSSSEKSDGKSDSSSGKSKDKSDSSWGKSKHKSGSSSGKSNGKSDSSLGKSKDKSDSSSGKSGSSSGKSDSSSGKSSGKSDSNSGEANGKIDSSSGKTNGEIDSSSGKSNGKSDSSLGKSDSSSGKSSGKSDSNSGEANGKIDSSSGKSNGKSDSSSGSNASNEDNHVSEFPGKSDGSVKTSEEAKGGGQGGALGGGSLSFGGNVSGESDGKNIGSEGKGGSEVNGGGMGKTDGGQGGWGWGGGFSAGGELSGNSDWQNNITGGSAGGGLSLSQLLSGPPFSGNST